MKQDKKQLRKNNCKVRLARIKRLREISAPLWVIKHEQIALVMNRKGMKYYGIGQTPSKKQAELVEKHVTPLMEN